MEPSPCNSLTPILMPSQDEMRVDLRALLPGVVLILEAFRSAPLSRAEQRHSQVAEKQGRVVSGSGQRGLDALRREEFLDGGSAPMSHERLRHEAGFC